MPGERNGLGFAGFRLGGVQGRARAGDDQGRGERGATDSEVEKLHAMIGRLVVERVS